MFYEMIKPYPLKEGDRIALVSPVNLPPRQYRDDQSIMDYLSNRGFETVNYIASADTEKKRSDTFNEAMVSGSQALLPISGNRYATDIFHRINYELFARMRPIFCTFSAASALLLALHFRSNMEVFYGPHISFIREGAIFRENNYTIASFWNMLTRRSDVSESAEDSPVDHLSFRWGNSSPALKNIFHSGIWLDEDTIPFIGYHCNQTSPLIYGRLLPSFLQSLDRALSSGIEVDFSGRIVLVESDEISFEQALSILKKVKTQADLTEAAAIVLASFVTYKQNPPNYKLQRELTDRNNIMQFTDKIKRLTNDNLPVIYGFPMGHLKYKLTIPMGIRATLNSETGDITLLESPFDRKEIEEHAARMV